jgi:hypothetical protein
MRPRTPLPTELRQALEEVFGEPVDGVAVHQNSWFARCHGRIRATTRRNAIYLCGSLDDFYADPELLLHEYYHVLRQWNRGRLRLSDYVAEWWRRGYFENRYERHARRFARTRLPAFRRALARARSRT